MRKIQSKLAGGASTLAVVAALGAAWGGSAAAQTQQTSGAPESSTQVEEIVVTGSSIRGAPPVGSNLVAVGVDEIRATNAQTAQQILKTVPAVTGLSSAGQGSFGSSDASGTNSPSIHGLGASASGSTLILVDGHRLPLSGINHTLADPNIVPSVAIQRVEVLAEGASSVYGSDAVAGVINFITRRNYNGVEISGQAGFGDSYRAYNGNILWGKGWDTGSALLAYSYSDRSALSAGDRSFTRLDHRAQGGTNFASFQCAPASIQPAGTSSIYSYPYNGAPVANVAANAMCDTSGVADLLPREHRNNVMLKVQQEFGDKIDASADVIFSDRTNKAQVSRGGVTATIFGPNSGRAGQINPFFTAPAGSTATSETVYFDANDLLGPGAVTKSGARDVVVDAEVVYHINDRFNLTFSGTAGEDDSRLQTTGVLCSSCAYLALNGTTNGSGSLTTPSIPGTNVVVTGTPLTAANALDVFNTGAANRTSAAVLARLTDSTQTQLAHQTLEDARLKFDGSLFDLPAGAVKIALGGEYARYTLRQDITRPNNTGPATSGSSTLNLNYDRTVKSAYAEVLVPIVSPEQEVPFVRSLQLDLSGRYDKYSDFGSTKNPKIAANWEVVDGVKIRGNYAESFVAPALTSIGSGGGVTGESGYSQFGQGAINVPVASFPGVVGLPGCAPGAVTCTVGNSSVTGLLINGGNGNLKAQTGKTYSIGADWNPQFVRGLRLSVTYWNNKLKGGVTSPTPALALNAASLNSLFTFFPGGATQAQIANIVGNLPQTGAIPATTYFIYDFRQQNVLNLDITGLDIDGSYRRSTDYGDFTIGGSVSRFLKFDQQIGEGSPVFDVNNTVGFNTTFPSIKTQARANVGWDWNDLSAQVFVNYTGGFRNWSSSTVTPVSKDSAGYPTGGGDKVKSYTTVDLHVSYKVGGFSLGGVFEGPEVYVDVNNLFDKDPPFYNSTNGYTTFAGNPIGRVVSVGFRAAM